MPDEERGGRPEPVRLDKWLWAARFFRTRSLAAEAIEGGKVQVNGDRAKRAKQLAPGDEVRVRQGPYEHIVIVRALSARRGSATVAAELFEETAASRATREALAAQMKAMFGRSEGRPTKKDRRDLGRLKGQ